MGTRTGNPTWENTPSEASPLSATALNNIEDVIDNSVPLDTFPEEVRDIIGAALVAGTNVTITVNDAGDTITIASSGGTPPDASTTVKGIVELATNAEVQAGLSNVLAVTPAGGASAWMNRNVINANGDLVVGSADNTPNILPIGTPGQTLVVDYTQPRLLRWSSPLPTGVMGVQPSQAMLPDYAIDFSVDGGYYSDYYTTPVKFTIMAPINIENITIDVTTPDSGATGYVAIWQPDSYGLPWILVDERPFAGSFSTTGITRASATGLTLQPGVYWVGFSALSASTLKVRGFRQLGTTMGVGSMSSALATNEPTWVVQGTSGGIPGGAAETITGFASADPSADYVPWIGMETSF
jgi:hypothetical protein